MTADIKLRKRANRRILDKRGPNGKFVKQPDTEATQISRLHRNELLSQALSGRSIGETTPAGAGQPVTKKMRTQTKGQAFSEQLIEANVVHRSNLDARDRLYRDQLSKDGSRPKRLTKRGLPNITIWPNRGIPSSVGTSHAQPSSGNGFHRHLVDRFLNVESFPDESNQAASWGNRFLDCVLSFNRGHRSDGS